MRAMLTVWLRCCCLAVLFSTAMSSSLHKPAGSRVPQLSNIVHNLEKRSRHSSQYGGSQPSVTRLTRPFQNIKNHYRRMWSEQRFADEMFRLFDRNSDNVIERDEFRSVLKLLGIIRY